MRLTRFSFLVHHFPAYLDLLASQLSIKVVSGPIFHTTYTRSPILIYDTYHVKSPPCQHLPPSLTPHHPVTVTYLPRVSTTNTARHGICVDPLGHNKGRYDSLTTKPGLFLFCACCNYNILTATISFTPSYLMGVDH
ncbi:Uncharacterized protein HZ326_3503 [Fusarium oxysporum f. sp. albedinis]|nr:Uncharacterized protein HZ326_3503 [Fusarium oxysporum f. sp. albedinis]